MTRLAFFDVDGTLINEGVWTMMLSHESLGQPAKRRVYADVLPVWIGTTSRRDACIGWCEAE